MKDLIALLQNQHLVWQGANKTQKLPHTPSGYVELDQQLEGGFSQGVTEIRSLDGIGELRLLLPLLKTSTSEERLIVFIAPVGVISPQALTAQGITLDKVLIVYADKHEDALWSAEQSLNSGACHSVVLWTETALAIHQIKRLQVASDTGNSHQFILRVTKKESLSLPFDLSLTLQPHPQGLHASINKRKGGWSSESFIINMAKEWPSLTLQALPNNLLHFPHVKAS